MHDGAANPLQGLKGSRNQVLARLGQHLDGHVSGNVLLFNQRAHEIEFGLRGRGKAHFDFFEAHAYQGLEEVQLAPHAHGLSQRLISVAQVHAAPDGRVVQAAARPGAVGQTH